MDHSRELFGQAGVIWYAVRDFRVVGEESASVGFQPRAPSPGRGCTRTGKGWGEGPRTAGGDYSQHHQSWEVFPARFSVESSLLRTEEKWSQGRLVHG